MYARGPGQPVQAEFNVIKVDLEAFLSGLGPTFMYLWMPGG
jgi:hypothetical protein